MNLRRLLTVAIIACISLSGGDAGAYRFGSGDFAYPTFPFTTIQRIRAASDFSGVSAHPVDTLSPGNPYGNITAPQFNFPSGGWTLLFAAITSAGPVDVRGGSIRINIMPAANSSFNLSQFNINLFSTTNISSPGTNFHQIGGSSRLGQLWTGTGASAGRWQTVAYPISAANAVNSGADLANVRFFQISGFGAVAFQLGDIEFVPNPRTKSAVVIRADDGDQSQYTVLFPMMSAAGAVGVIAPSPISTVINGGGHLTSAQWKAMLAAGWQNMSQGYTTEDFITIDNWSTAQRMAEWGAIRPFVAQAGHGRDAVDGSWMSSFGPKDMIAGPDFMSSFRSAANFTGGQATGNPLPSSETFPFGDRYNYTCLNLNTWGDVTDIYESHIFLALEQTRAANGFLCVAFHNEMGIGTNYSSAVQKILNYVTVLHPDQMEMTTIRKMLAPYNGDSMQNFLLKRDLDPASNDNDPMWMEKAA